MKKRFGMYSRGSVRFDSSQNGCYLSPRKRPARSYMGEFVAVGVFVLVCLALTWGAWYIILTTM